MKYDQCKLQKAIKQSIVNDIKDIDLVELFPEHGEYLCFS